MAILTLHISSARAVFYLFLAGMVSTYLVLVELAKKWFYKRYSHRQEQFLKPRKIGPYLNRRTRLIQDIVAAVCLHVENEIRIDSLFDDLARSVSYPADAEHILRGLHHLQRSGFVKINMRDRIVKREEVIREYVAKTVVKQFWPQVSKDWRRISIVLQTKYGQTNAEYQNLFTTE